MWASPMTAKIRARTVQTAAYSGVVSMTERMKDGTRRSSVREMPSPAPTMGAIRDTYRTTPSPWTLKKRGIAAAARLTVDRTGPVTPSSTSAL